MSFTSFDSSTKSANVTLSNSDRTAAFPGGGGGDQGVKAFAADAASSGKRYFEVTVDTFAGGDNGVGICLNNGVTYVNIGASATDSAIVLPSGSIWIAGSYSGHGLASVPSGHVVGIAVDLSAHLIWFKDITAGTIWNGIGGADPATGTGGLTIQSGAFIPVVVFSQFNAAQATYNFGASSFTGSVPSGFTSGWTAAGGGGGGGGGAGIQPVIIICT